MGCGQTAGRAAHRERRSASWRHRVAAVAVSFSIASLAVVAAVSLPPTAAAAQDAASSPGLFGLWPQTAADLPPGADVVAVMPLAGSTDDILRIGVRFAAPFEPADGYRISVVVGDPSSDVQLRVTYRFGYGVGTGSAEALTAGEWSEVAPSTIGGSPADGALEFDLPRGLLAGADDPTVADPAALWVETEVPVDKGLRYAVSNYFAFAAFLPDALVTHPTTAAGLAPVIGASGWGAVQAYATSTPFPLQPALKAPTLAIANSGLLITTELPVPTAVDGQQVNAALDRVHVLAADLTAPSPGYVQIDRVTGAVDLHHADGSVVPGDPTWLGDAPDVADPGAAGTVTVDLPAVAGLLGLPQDPQQLAVSADRAIELADLRTVVATSTGATASVIGEVAAPAAPATTAAPVVAAPEDASTDSGTSSSLVRTIAAIVTIIVVGFLVAAAWVAVGRRRRSDYDLLHGGHPDTPVPTVGEGVVELPSSGQERAAREARTGGASPDEVIAALERQFAEFGVPSSGSGDTDGREQPF